jgi:tRNA(adenine34) deaminase
MQANMRNEERWMKEAFEEGLKAFDDGEVPVGAVVVKDGAIIGRGHNRVEGLDDPTAHAEIIAISAACNTLKDWRLNGAVLYVTVEPCLMCGGAILHSRLSKVVYAVKEPKFGSFGTVTNILEKNKFNHQVIVEQTDYLKKEIENLLIEFFRQKRQKTKAKNG